MNSSNEQDGSRPGIVSVNDRAGILSDAALHPKLRAGAEKPTTEDLMELLDELVENLEPTK